MKRDVGSVPACAPGVRLGCGDGEGQCSSRAWNCELGPTAKHWLRRAPTGLGTMHSAGRERTVRLRPHTSVGVLLITPTAPWVSGTARTDSCAGRPRRPETSDGNRHRNNRRDPGLPIARVPALAEEPVNECAWAASGLFFQSQGADLRPRNAFGGGEPTSPSPADGGGIEQGRAGPSAHAHSDEVTSLLAANKSLQRRLQEAESRRAVTAVEAKNAAQRAVSGEIKYLVAENEDLKRQLARAQQEAWGKPRTLMCWKVAKGFASLQDRDRTAALEQELDLVQPALRKARRDRDYLHAQLQESSQKCTELTSELHERNVQVRHMRAQAQAREQEASTIAELKGKVASLEQELKLMRRELQDVKQLPEREDGAPPGNGGPRIESAPSE